MTRMEDYPDMYFGAYPSYCKADPRYCSEDIFIEMVQGGTAVFVTPLCILAVVGLLWKMKAMKNSAILVASAIQMTQTIYFFVEPFKLEVNPIPTTGRQFYFDFLFMNNLWIWIPLWFIYKTVKKISRAQASHNKLKEAQKQTKTK